MHPAGTTGCHGHVDSGPGAGQAKEWPSHLLLVLVLDAVGRCKAATILLILFGGSVLHEGPYWVPLWPA